MVLQYAQKEETKKIAANIISVQEKEIAEYTALLGMFKNKSAGDMGKMSPAYDKKAKKAMDDMMNAMLAVKVSGTVDRDFLAAMIEHHKGAVSAAKLVLEYGKDAQVKNIARTIISAQEKEIGEFRKILSKNR